MDEQEQEFQYQLELARAKARAKEKLQSEVEQKAPLADVQEAQGEPSPPVPSGRDPSDHSLKNTKTNAINLPNAPFYTPQFSNMMLTGAGVWNAAKNVAQSAAAAPEIKQRLTEPSPDDNILQRGLKFASRLTDDPLSHIIRATDVDEAQWIEENIPEFKGANTADQVGMDVAGVTAAMATPMKVLPATSMESLAAGYKLLANVGKYVTGAIGSVNTLDNKEGAGIISGKDAFAGDYVGYFSGIFEDPDGNFSMELGKARAKAAMEAIVLAKPIEMGLRGAAEAGKLFYNLTAAPAMNWQRLEPKIQRQAMDFINSLKVLNPLTDTPQVAAQKVDDIAEKVRRGAYKDLESGIQGVGDEAGNVRITRPTGRAYVEGAGEQITQREEAAAGGMHSAYVNRQLPELEARIQEPANKLRDTLKQTEDVFGGEVSANSAKNEVLTSAKNQMDELEGRVTSKEADINKADTDFASTVKDDEFLGPIAKDAENGVKLDLRTPVNDKADEIVGEYTQFRDNLKEEGDKLFNRVPKNTKYDKESFMKEYNKVKEYLPADLQAMVEKSDGTYRYLRNNIGTDLNDYITDLYRKGDSRIAKKLKGLKDNIYNEQDKLLKGRGVNTTSQKYSDAVQEYKDKQVPYQQGPGEDIYQIQKNKRTTEKYYGQPDEAAVESRKILKNTLNDPDAAEHVDRILSTVQDPKLRTDFVLGHLAEDISDQIATKGIGELDTNAIAKSLRARLNTLGPEGTARAEKLINTLNQKKGDIKGLRTELDAIRKETEKARDQIYNKELSHFFTKGGAPREDPYKIFGKYMGDEDAVERIREVKARVDASQNPVAQQGLKAVYARWLKSQVFGEQGPLGPQLNPEMLKKLEAGTDTAFKVGKEILGDDSSLVKLYQSIVEEGSKNKLMGQHRKATLSNIMESEVAMRGATDIVITQIWGTLNRIGARVRSLAGKAITNTDSQRMTLEAMEIFASDPMRAASAIDSIAAKYRGQMNKEVKMRILDALVISGAIKPEHAKAEEKDNTIEAFNPPSKNKEDKTKEAFKIDTSRPILENDDGSFSTEETATRQDENGKWVVFPTIVGGKRLSEDEAWDKLRTGENKSVGEFDTLEESEDYAVKRSQEIGKVREKDRKK